MSNAFEHETQAQQCAGVADKARNTAQRWQATARKGVSVSVLCAVMVLIGLPSVGSRLEDATLTSETRARLVMASVQGSNPAERNEVLQDAPETPPVRVAKLDHDVTNWRSPALAVRGEPPAEVVAEAYDAGESAPSVRPLPRERAQFVALAHQTRISSSGSMAAPAALAPPTPEFAPEVSLLPKTRPDGMEYRALQYTRHWLRSVDLRPLNKQEACLATAVYHEARGETLRGQFAVAEVIMNRVSSAEFPNSICGVVYQGVREGQMGGCQFSFACDGQSEAMPNRRSARKARRIAQVMSNGGRRGLTEGALYFHTTAVNPPWAQQFRQTTQIGAHLFYRG